MMRRLASLVVLLAAAGIWAPACGEPEQAPAFPEFSDKDGIKRPNVLIVLVDALRRDHLGTYGYPLPTSPNIDSFADESFRFTRAYSHSTWTKPSIATLFTSVYPAQHGLGRVGFMDEAGFQTDVLPKRLVTLAERLKKEGYATAAFSTNVHIERKTGFAQGFDHFFWRRLVGAFELGEMLEEWIDARDQDVPFFAYLHYMDAHFPYDHRLESESGRFGNTSTDPPAPEHWSLVPQWAAEHLDDENLAAIVASYDEEIAFIDQAFGKLVDWLESRGLMDETVIVFVADHGEGFNEHGELQHGFAPYEEVTAIPLFVRVPSAYGLEPRSVSTLAGLIDVMPTVLELVDLEIPRRAQGRSLAGLFLGHTIRERPVFLEGAGFHGLRGPTHSVLAGGDGMPVCFDSVADPGELSPILEPWPDPCTRLATSLQALIEQFGQLAVADAPNATVTLNEEEIEALRALGYLD